DGAFCKLIFARALVFTQVATQIAEYFCQQSIQNESGNAESRFGQWPGGGFCVARDKHGCVRGYCTGFEQFVAHAKSRQSFLTMTANEFSAHTVARVMPCFPYYYGNALTTKADAQGQARETAADDCDGPKISHSAQLPSSKAP